MTIQKKNILINLKITSEMDQNLSEIADNLDISKVDLMRLFLNTSINRLKADVINAGGYDNLEFTIRKE
jgi:hypothetical protein